MALPVFVVLHNLAVLQAPKKPTKPPTTSSGRPATKKAAPPKAVKPTTPSAQAPDSSLALLEEVTKAYKQNSGWQAPFEIRRLSSRTLPARPAAVEYIRVAETAKPFVVGDISAQKDNVRLRLAAPASPLKTRLVSVSSPQFQTQLRFDDNGTPQQFLQGPLTYRDKTPSHLRITASGLFPEEIISLIVEPDSGKAWREKNRLDKAVSSGGGYVGGVPCDYITLTAPGVLSASEKRVPGEPERDLKRLTLVVGRSDRLLRQAILEDVQWGRQGEVTVVTFGTIKPLARATPDEFTLKAPPGVPVLRYGGSALSGGTVNPLPPGRRGGPKLLESVENDPDIFSFGEVSLLDTRYVTRTFTVTNDQKQPWELLPPRGTCPCMSGRFVPSGKSVLKPGESIQVQATLDLLSLRPGSLEKSLVIERAEKGDAETGEQVARFVLSGTLKPSYMANKEIIDLGQWSREDDKSKGTSVTFSIRFDPRLVTRQHLEKAELITDDPQRVQIVPLPTEAAPGTWPEARFRISVPDDAPLGPLRTRVRLNPLQCPSEAPVPRALWNRVIDVVGNVTGDVSATPTSVYFDSETTQQSIVLTASRADMFDNLRLTSDSEQVFLRIFPDSSKDTFTVPNRTLEITVMKSNGPRKHLSTQVNVILKNGQRLVLPVIIN